MTKDKRAKQKNLVSALIRVSNAERELAWCYDQIGCHLTADNMAQEADYHAKLSRALIRTLKKGGKQK